MAEVLAVVASGAGLASLAIQLGENARKLRQLYVRYKEAPGFLENISYDLETLALALHRVERDRQTHNTVDYEIVERCVQMCRRAIEQVHAAVSKLEVLLERSSSKGRFLVALKHPSLLEQRDELDRARSSLSFAYQLYSESCRETANKVANEKLDRFNSMLQSINLGSVTASTIDDRSAHDMKSRHGNDAVDSTLYHTSSGIIRRRDNAHQQSAASRRNENKWHFRLSPWLASRIWEVSFEVAGNGFTFNLKTCNIVPEDSPIFELCRLGDLKRVRALFHERKASPYDCTYNPWCSTTGTTVLAAAAESENIELCQYLIDTAGFPIAPERSENPIDAYIIAVRNRGSRPHWSAAPDMYRMLLKAPNLVDAGVLDGIGLWWFDCPNSSCLQLIKDELRSDLNDMSWEDRVYLAICASRSREDALPAMFLDMLDETAVNAKVAHAQDANGNTALHMVAERIYWNGGTKVQSWVEFIQQLLASGADLHKQNAEGNTPFFFLLQTALVEPGRTVKSWVSTLQSVRIDLRTYGEQEMALWQDVYPDGMIHFVDKYTKSWTYGSNSEDWTVIRMRSGTVPLYRLERIEQAPGTWPKYGTPPVATICWYPGDADEIEGPWQWVWYEDVTLWSDAFPDPPLDHTDEEQGFDIRAGLDGSQDDCAAYVRAVEQSVRWHSRPRSHSQPRGLHGLDENGHGFGMWLPQFHQCPYDGRRRFADSVWWDKRNCAKGVHTQDGDSTYQERINEQMRLFRCQYESEAELRALPYSAYSRRR